MPRLRDAAINGCLSLASVILFLIFCELVIFRFVWLASDAPRNDFVADVVRYAPNQKGVWRVRNEIAAPYHINAEGWNSGVGDYRRQRTAGVMRIAVVGDSYVEALQVANTASVAEDLKRSLASNGGQAAEVFRFGISGAPLSQYVHMVEREVLGYQPNWIVVIVVHNDFDESYEFVQGRYTSSFLKFRVVNGRVTGEIPPTPWHPGLSEWMRRTATARFFLYRWQIRPQALVDLFLPRSASAAQSPWTANVDIGHVLTQLRAVEAVADHGAGRLAALGASVSAHVLMVMDGDREAIYGGDTSPALVLNRVMHAAAERHGISFLDLHPVFAAHWAAHHQRFDFYADAHWNELGHAVAGAAIAAFIREHKAP